MTQGERFGAMLFTWCGGCLVLALLAIFRPNDVRVWMQLSLLAYGLLVGTFGLLNDEPGPVSDFNAWTTCILSALGCWTCVALWWLLPKSSSPTVTPMEIQYVLARALVAILAIAAGAGLHLWKGKDT